MQNHQTHFLFTSLYKSILFLPPPTFLLSKTFTTSSTSPTSCIKLLLPSSTQSTDKAINKAKQRFSLSIHLWFAPLTTQKSASVRGYLFILINFIPCIVPSISSAALDMDAGNYRIIGADGPTHQVPDNNLNRPGYNTASGRDAREVQVRVNQFKVTQWPQKDVYQYDVRFLGTVRFFQSLTLTGLCWQWCRKAWYNQGGLGVTSCSKATTTSFQWQLAF
jgi:hypothetical protein